MTCRCTVPPRGPTDSMVGGRDCPDHPALPTVHYRHEGVPPMSPTAAEVSDSLLDTFDRITGGGETLPLDEIKRRYRESDYFRFREGQIYTTVVTLPVQVEMITQDTAGPVSKVLDGLRELYGEELELTFSDRHGGEPTLTARTWRDEAQLRRLWKEFAEETYKAELHGGAY